MKIIYIISLLITILVQIKAETDSIQNETNKIIISKENENIQNDTISDIIAKTDTTRMRIGKKSIRIIKDGDDTYFKVMDSKNDKNKDFDFEIEDDELNLNKKKKIKHFDGHLSGIDLGINLYGNSIYNTELNNGNDYMELNTGKSYNLNFNIVQQSISLFSNNLGIVTGLGVEFSNYSFDNNNTIVRDSTGTITPINFTRLLKYSSLKTTYLTIPVILELQIPTSSKKNIPVFFSAGVIGGLKLRSKTKYKFSDTNQKTKNPDNYNLSPFRYGLTFRCGYKSIKIYSNIYFSSLFERKGPKLFPFAIGLSLLPFK